MCVCVCVCVCARERERETVGHNYVNCLVFLFFLRPYLSSPSVSVCVGRGLCVCWGEGGGGEWSVFVCVCVRACVRACVHACVCVCVISVALKCSSIPPCVMMGAI